MAATNPSARESTWAERASESGVGMAHPTVVPTNFETDREEAGTDGDER